VLNRDGILGQFTPENRVHRMPDPKRHIAQMQPWVRQFLAAQDVLFALDWSGHSSSTGPSHCAMRIRGGDVLMQMERPSLDLFQNELMDVIAMADLRSERSEEILSQIDHQWAYWGSLVPLRPDLKPRTMEVLQAMLWLCVSVEMRFKQVLAVHRPQDLSSSIQPIITTPGHGSYPMGHATQAYAIAQILKSLMRLDAKDPLSLQLDRQAHRIGINRIVAGVHFPVDLAAGMLLGKSIAAFAHACAQNAPVPVSVFSFTESQYQSQPQSWSSAEALSLAALKLHKGQALVTTKADQMPVWTLLWEQALQEWVRD
jgi:hypothetical protein